MDLLSYIGELRRRKESLIERARELYDEHDSVKKMEEEMEERNHALVLRLRTDRIRFSEFQRTAADETIIAACAGRMLGLKSPQLSEKDFAECCKALPYLWKFFAAIQSSLDSGRLDTSLEFEENDILSTAALTAEEILADNGIDIDELDPDVVDEIVDQVSSTLAAGTPGKSTPASWQGVESRLGRYLVTPIYGAAMAGGMELATNIGYREMRRVSKNDKKTCEDCRMWDGMGWVPIGLLPAPGQMCRCHDNCRCYIDYR